MCSSSLATHRCLKSGMISIQILRKLAFPERLLFHYLMINIGYNEQRSIFYIFYTGLKSTLNYLQNNIKQIIIIKTAFLDGKYRAGPLLWEGPLCRIELPHTGLTVNIFNLIFLL